MKQNKRKTIAITFIIMMLLVISFSIVSFFSNKALGNITFIKWDGTTVATSFSRGNGSEQNPYLISTPEELIYFKNIIESDINYTDKYYKLSNNIDLNNHPITPIGDNNYFKGNLNGDGYIIKNINITTPKIIDEKRYYGLFTKIEGDVSNLILDSTIINANENNNLIGTLSPVIKANLKNIIIKNSSINLLNTTNNSSEVGVLSSSIENNININNIIIDGTISANYSEKVTKISNTIKSNMNNIILRVNYNGNISQSGLNNVNNYNNKTISFLYNLDNNNKITYNNNILDINEVLNRFNNISNDFEFNYSNTFTINKRTSKPKKQTPTTRAFRNAEALRFSTHNSGVEGNKLHINELIEDYNHFKGLNYTYNNANNLPTQDDKNIYNNSNLVRAKIVYKAQDIDNINIGSLSNTENINEFIYYKYYYVPGNTLELKLIDNPFSRRPNNLAFNGWVTEYENVTISYNSDTYERTATIPIVKTANTVEDIVIVFYASWTEAKVELSGSSINSLKTAINNLNNKGMQRYELVDEPIYGEVNMNGYYYKKTFSYYDSLTGYYNVYGEQYGNGSYCQSWNCTVYERIENENFNPNNTYYYFSNGYMRRLDNSTITIPIIGYNKNPLKNRSYASWYRKIKINYYQSKQGYYDNQGNKESGVCTSYNGCDVYKLLQYKNENGEVEKYLDNDQIYYLVTRDTNIIFLDNNVSIGGGGSSTILTTKKPLTITGINNGIDNSNNQLKIDSYTNSNIQAEEDLRIENLTLRAYYSNGGGSYSPGSESFRSSIVGNFNNLKIGRNIKTTGSQFNAMAVIAGNRNSTGSQNNPTKYTMIVESGYYNALSGVGTTQTYSTYNVAANIIYGNDYDKITNNNNNLRVYYTAASSWGGTVNSSSENLFADTTIKSGTFGMQSYEPASGFYVGGLNGGTLNNPASVTVEGGKILHLNGGPLVNRSKKHKNTIYINIKNGEQSFIFGGAARTETYGNRIINITGGTVDYAVFGGSNGYSSNGSESARGTVDGDTYLYIGGKTTIGKTNLSSKYGVEPGNIFGIGNGNSNYEVIGSANNSNIIIADEAKINSNVYGGGNYGAVGTELDYGKTTTKIKIIGGNILGSVYGGGNNNGSGSKKITSNVHIDLINGKIANNIYGGSKTKGIIYGNTHIEAINGKLENIFGGGEGGYSGYNSPGTFVSQQVNIKVGNENTNDLLIRNNVYGGSAYGSVNGKTNSDNVNTHPTIINVNNGIIQGSVFGGGMGSSSFTPKVYGPIIVNINNGNIGKVFGGNDQNGSPSSTSTVYLNGGIIGNAFGGGNNTGQNTTNINLTGSTVTGNIYGGSNQSGIVNNTTVNINSGNVIDVFGGNNLGGSVNTTAVNLNGGTTNDIYGGGNKAETTHSNTIISHNTNNVYGGGNQAGVSNKSTIKINDGNLENVFGGSNKTGHVASTSVSVADGIINNIYGGNNLGGSTNNTEVLIEGGQTKLIFGGGNQVGVNNTHIHFNGGFVNSIYGGSNQSGTVNNSNLFIGNNNSSGVVENVYGGNNLGGYTNKTKLIVKNTNVSNLYGGGNQAEIGDSSITTLKTIIGNIYGGGNQAKVRRDTTIDLTDTTVTNNIYGGGNQGEVDHNTNVYITDSQISGSAYAGGNGQTAIVKNNTNITIDGTTTVGSPNSTFPNGSVFGGGNAAATGTAQINSSVARVNIVGGHIYGNVYGGANTSIVYGTTQTNIGTNVVNYSNLKEENLIIEGTVFGGGEANASGSENYDFSFISVTQGIDVYIDGANYLNNNHKFLLNGSIFGSGNASSSAGISTVYIRNLGNRKNPSTNISIQRANKVVIDNSTMEFSGTVDTTNDYATIKYSLNRIDEFILKNNSMILLKENANLLKSFKSMKGEDGLEEVATVTIDDETKTVTKNVDNRVYLLGNKNLNIATNQDATAYGKVTGMTFFGMYLSYAGGNRIYGVYSDDYNYGDEADASKLINAGSYILGMHALNHDITKDGFYTNYLDKEANYSEVITKYVVPHPQSADYYIWSIGEKIINYEFTMTASKYSSLGTYNLSMVDFPNGNTIFNVIGFNAEGLKAGVQLVDSDLVPKIAYNQEDANKILGLSMKAETREWTSYGTTKLLGKNNGTFTGTNSYKTDAQVLSPSMMFYFYHAKNISLTDDLGTVVVTLQTLTPKNEIEYDEQLVNITINLNAQEYNDAAAYDASITYDKKYELPSATAVNITNKSQFTAYYSIVSNTNSFEDFYGQNGTHYRALVSDYNLPVGTQITMIDNYKENHPEEYYYTVTQADYNNRAVQLQNDNEATYRLSNFIRMDSVSSNNKYNDYQMNRKYYLPQQNLAMEEFIFIFDFKRTNITGEQIKKSMLFELRNKEDRTMYHVVTPRIEIMRFSTFNESNTVLDQTITLNNHLHHDIDSTGEISTSVLYNQTQGRESIIDTNYESSAMGLNLSIYDNSGNKVSSSLLTGTTLTVNQKEYFADYDGVFRVKLAGKVSNIKADIIINTSKTLPTGNYQFKFTLFASSDGLHNTTPEKSKTVVKDIIVIGSDNSIVVKTEDKFKLVDGNTGKNKIGSNYAIYNLKYNSVLQNPNIRVSLYKRDTTTSDSTNMKEIEISEVFNAYLPNPTGILTQQSLYEKLLFNQSGQQNIVWTYKDNLKSGTYKLEFKLYDNNQLIDTDTEYLIIKKKVN